MNIYEELGVRTFINAVDSETVLGGSLMPKEVLQAMNEASKHFVELEELEKKASEEIAKLTRNEACFITNSAAAGLTIAVSACITGKDPMIRDSLPYIEKVQKQEVIIHRCQRNGFDFSVRQTGAKIVEIGNFMETNSYELESSINDRTACIVYFAGSIFEKGALALEEVVTIAREYSIPVIVDAAAQLPPVENLWLYTEMGADMVIFSGGKTLRGPQASGLILGKKSFIEACRMNASPNYSIGRSMKIGKEEIVGLLYAVRRYISLDHEKQSEFYEQSVKKIIESLNFPPFIKVKRLYPGPVGQHYPRAGIYFQTFSEAEKIYIELKEGSPSIRTTLSIYDNSIIINPLHLDEEEIDIIIERLNMLLSNH